MAELKKLNLDTSATAITNAPQQVAKLTQTVAKPVIQAATTTPEPHKKLPIFKIILPIVIILAGVGSGYAVSSYLATGSLVPTTMTTEVSSSGVKVGDIIGVPDAETFKDSTEGVLQKGGLSGEGSHQLLRPGGPSQTVYLTSSVIDLDELVGNKIKVWGETFKGQKAGWLMDVGRVQVLELDVANPE